MKKMVYILYGPTRRNPFQGGMGFSTIEEERERREASEVAIPFRVGWGFRPVGAHKVEIPLTLVCRNPFQGGMGFSTFCRLCVHAARGVSSQSLSGWDGVFDYEHLNEHGIILIKSQSLSGWDGVFD